MGLETGTYVDDLVITNPPGGDDKRQGDDHIRLIKTVLRNTIKRGSKALYLPGTVAKTATYTVLESDENLTIVVNTSGAQVNLTLPTLDSSRLGWKIYVMKTTTDASPFFIFPPSGTLNGFAYVRRSIPFATTVVEWSGVWTASRPNGGAPIGSVLEYYGASLPQGHLWADGSAFSTSSYIELLAALGGGAVPDRRGRVGIGRDDMGGSAAQRVTVGVSGITGTSVLSAGGAQSVALDTSMLPVHAHSVLSQHSGGSLVIGAEDTDHTHLIPQMTTGGVSADHTHGLASNGLVNNFGGGLTIGSGNPYGITQPLTTGVQSADHNHTIPANTYNTGVRSAAHAHAISGSTQNAGSGAAHNNMPPGIVCNAIVVAE